MSETTYYTFWGIRFYPKQLHRAEGSLVLLDLVMLILFSINITLFILYWAYDYYRISQFFANQLPAIDKVLAPIHAEFPLIDLIFVIVFLTEFGFRWILAIVQKTYHRWFFYPFIHWYDLIGCLPFGSFRFLRILRIFSLVNRLQRLGVIDIRDTYLYSRYRKYRAIIVEEITDKVILNVLDGVKTEVKQGLPITDRLFKEVIQPNKPILVQWLSQRLQTVTASSFRLYQPELETYVNERIEEAVRGNPELGQIKRVPVLGQQVTGMIENAIKDIVYHVLTGIIKDIASGEHSHFLDEFSDVAIATIIREDKKEENEALNQIINRMVIEILEVVEAHIRVQEWKLQRSAEAEGFEFMAQALADDEPIPPTEKEQTGTATIVNEGPSPNWHDRKSPSSP